MCLLWFTIIDAADPEKLIFQKALLLALDQKKTLLLEQDQIIGLYDIAVKLEDLGSYWGFYGGKEDKFRFCLM